jgi:hypothetical protein
MWWNPTSDIVSPTFIDLWVGGKQYIYVTREKYDGCEAIPQLPADWKCIGQAECI